MKLINTLLSLCMILLCCMVEAQVTVNDKLDTNNFKESTHRLTVDNHHAITVSQDEGIVTDKNLFHSFGIFNIGKNQTITFTGSDNLQNVISRVTGGDVSHINGELISTIGKANFYFFNPAGVVFGKGAVVDVPAAFHISTGNSLNFKDGAAFFASLAKASTLSVAEPKNFDFLSNHLGDIKINLQDQDTTLDFYVGKNVSLAASRDIILNKGSIGFYTEKPVSLKAGRDIILTEGKITNASGAIKLNAVQRLSLTNGSVIDTDTYSAKLAGTINITAPHIEVNTSTIHSDTWSEANANTVTINSDTLMLDNKGEISSKTWAGHSGNGGTVTIDSDTVTVTNEGRINSSTYDEGNAGKVELKNNKKLILDHGFIYSAAWTSSTGNAGKIKINSDHITLKNNGEISSFNGGIGKKAGGDVSITSELLNLQSKGHIYTYSKGGGTGGDIDITADVLLMDDAVIKAKANNRSSGNITLKLNAIIPSQNQLQVDYQPFANSEPNGSIANNIEAANRGQVSLNAPQLNLSGSIRPLNYNILTLPDFYKDTCANIADHNSSLAHASKGGSPIDESQFTFIPSATIPSNEQLKMAVTPNTITIPAEENFPCAPLSL